MLRKVIREQVLAPLSELHDYVGDIWKRTFSAAIYLGQVCVPLSIESYTMRYCWHQQVIATIQCAGSCAVVVRIEHILTLVIVALFVALPSLAVSGEVLDRIKKTGTLTVMMDPEWPPMSVRRSDGEFEGFDVDFVNEVARRLNVKVAYFLPYSFDAVLAGGWGGRWDIATSVTPTVERGQHITFATTYSYGVSALAVDRQSSIKVPEDASGKRIGVLDGTEYEKILTREPFNVLGMPPITYKIKDPVIVRFQSTEEVYRALTTGDGDRRVDAVLDDLTSHMFRIKEGAPIRIVGTPLSYTPTSIAIEHGDPELAARLDEVVAAMRSDGTLSTISLKWFDYDFTQPN